MKVDINITAIIILVIFIGGAYGFYRYAMDSQYRVSSETAKKLLADKQFDVVIDVRTLLERNTMGSYPGSVHIPSQELTKNMQMMFPNKETRVLVYCNTGQRARVATDIFQGMGYTNAVYIASGHRSIMD